MLRGSYLRLISLTILLIALPEEFAARDYEGYQLLEVIPKTESDVRTIANLPNALGEHLDFWKESRAIDQPTEIFLSPESKSRVVKYLKDNSIAEYRTKIENVGEIVQADALDTPRPPPSAARDEQVRPFDINSFDFNEYHSHAEINDYLKFVATNKSKFVDIKSMGISHEGRQMSYLKIGYPSNEPKNAFFVDAGIHAREWITPAVALHFINELVTNPELTVLLENIDVYVLPSVNPDGYEYSRNSERLWRKSRSGPRGAEGCYGVDPNRNFDFYWGYSGVSHDPCSEIYCGPEALSESECQHLTDFLLQHNDTIKAYVTLHSYGNLIIHPWGHKSNAVPDDVNDIIRVGTQMARVIREAGGPEFTVGTGPDILYEVSGSSQDFAKHVGIKYAYTMELTNTPTGFILPKSRIAHTAGHILPALFVVAEEVRNTDADNTHENIIN
ncbi:zinc carboxypeptidase domain-containing protein [Ditylenchus destructor]|uniref:Zinc carboxypeptidase domain-containing protein n=1 Tax=Ditylenchus destructor TaxID=166010 RepID=A0AAD4QW03_9BILA|nr:zinc carboxypeptidase domain-containing protein [Ditylenchus destructor]